MEGKNFLKGYELLGIATVGAILILSVLISGCVEEKPPANETEKKTKTWVDYFNRTVDVPIHPQKIIVLDKANTEILFTMGVGDRIIGRCGYCNSPQDILKLPDCGYSSNPNFEVILNLSPDLIIFYISNMQGYEGKYKEALGRLEKYNLTVVAVPPIPYEVYGVMDYIKNDGKLVGEEEKAEKIVEEMKKKVNFVEEKVKNLKDSEKPRVAMVTRPYGGKIYVRIVSPIEEAGGINVFRDIKLNSQETTVNPEALFDNDPDVIIVTYWKYADEILKGKTKEEVEKDTIKEMEKIPGWNKLKAVKNNRVYVIDSYLTYGTPRVADGLIEVAKCIHPELFGAEKKTKTWVDAFNRTVEVPVHPQRIIAFSSSDVEILFAMGLGDRMVGRSNYVKYPPEAFKLTDCGSLPKPNFEVILNQSPDLVILYNLPSYITEKNYEDMIERFKKYNITVVVDPPFPNTVYEVMNHIKNMGKLVGEEEKAEKIVEEMNKKLNFVKEKVKNLKDNEKLKAAIVLGPYGEQLWVQGTSYPIEDAGGINVFSGLKGKYETGDYINPESLLDKNPDVIIIVPHGYDIYRPKEGKTKEEMEKEVIGKMEKVPGWNKLKAVKNHRICVIDDYKMWGSSKTADGLIEVAKCIHPELFGNETLSR